MTAWTSRPLGLEQGFDVARRPAGSGALTLALAVPASARLDHGTVLLQEGLRYAGVQARDAGGRAFPAWLQVRDEQDRGLHAGSVRNTPTRARRRPQDFSKGRPDE
jgi:hypothetical protein